jgi:Fe-Mn family superoxide dismutase
MKNTRRTFIKNATMSAIGLGVASCTPKVVAEAVKTVEAPKPVALTFTLPALPYAFDALEPVIDKMTMEIHHGKHHQAYVNNLNKALIDTKNAPTSLEDILKNISKYDAPTRNNAGGHFNHSLFWSLMRPATDPMEAEGTLKANIMATFGSVEAMQTKFNETATKIFGSGWAWLIKDATGKLQIISTPNQDNPLMDIAAVKGTPILALDVWEHAYYLKYQNVRKDYVANWWKVVNWKKANELFNA